ncbi:MAG TPA: YqiA/YcfP family alpha/beta fold hydrolase [Thermoanaerobaculia bacterium]|nr:YqiA/YcfP family alpha/beta fold hydrolase [Thermoanaerobaculia bacterium]
MGDPLSVLYFHGFASSPHGRKVEALTRLLEPEGIVLNPPDLNAPSFGELDWDAMIGRALEAGRRTPPAAIAGSSLGSLVALEVVRRGIAAPLILIAPAVGIGDRWRPELPPGDPVMVFHYALEREVPIHRKFFDQIEKVEPERDAPGPPVSIVMGRDDESVPFERVRGVWEEWTASRRLAAGSRFIEIARGDHGLTDHVGVIADEIRRRVKSEA